MIPTELQTQAKVPPKSVDILVVGGFQTDQGVYYVLGGGGVLGSGQEKRPEVHGLLIF